MANSCWRRHRTSRLPATSAKTVCSHSDQGISMKRIGIVMGVNDLHQVAMHRSYVDCVLAAGGCPVLVPAVGGAAGRLESTMSGIDGVLLVGGGDIDPSMYGQKQVASLEDLDPERDEVEMAILQRARRRGIRVLAICRGAQLIAVSHGGSLIQDLPAAGYFGHHAQGVADGYAAAGHSLTTKEGSLARRILGANIAVNSHHHQGIVEVGRGIEASGWSDDGLVEVIEGEGLLGVQWHPERMAGNGEERQAALFEWLTGE
ncbi:gamma-glutamyl-gamma-aminobutyrate hydrolase family protein [Pseudonocardia sp. Cha107L01]|uniref:gamma-glutamyl-gamma-aminobutyrate hydrolase family protein n=1 Tax=Pseudonocardia sp. Cha107L01 TaxID=3457576 RepID=UPI00403E79D9